MHGREIFTGERWEAYTGLVFLRARYYESTTGRFTSQDALPGNPQQPQTFHRWAYTENDPINRVDPTGYFSDDAISRSLRGLSFDEAFGDDEYGVGRWGLFALLRDAVDGNKLLARAFVNPEEHGHDYLPLRADEYGVWELNCDVDSQEVVFSNEHAGQRLPLAQFLQILGARADQMSQSGDINKLWRPNSLRFHWYELIPWYSERGAGKLYSDFTDTTDLPEVWLFSAGLGGQAAIITDRYGQQYFSLGFDWSLGLSLAAFWEGYAEADAGIEQHIESPGELRGIIEGPGATVTGMTPMAGVALYTSDNGQILFFGGINLGAEIGYSPSWTWYIGQDFDAGWDWVDFIPRFGAGTKETPNAPDPVTCGCD